MNISEWLIRTARAAPDAPALQTGSKLVADYQEFARRSGAFASHLRNAAGLQPGGAVAIYMPNRIEYLIVMYGVWLAGGTVVPINAKLHWKEALDIVSDSRSCLLVIDGSADAGLRRGVEESGCATLSVDDPLFGRITTGQPPVDSPWPRADSDPAWLFYTSGTTGSPKGAIISHGNLIAMSLSYLADVDEVTSKDAILYAAPMSHGAGLYNFMFVLRGSRHVVPPSGSFDALEVLELARSCGPVSMFAAPTIVRRLASTAQSLGEHGEGIRTIVYGGGPMYLADIQSALDIFGNRFVQIYGQGESPMCITVLKRSHISDRTHPRWESRLTSVGIPQSCVEVMVVDEGGNPVPAGDVGEVIVRGPTVMNGYWNEPEATARTLRDGWLWTGDMGTFDEEGFLTLKDRSKDVIISGGTNIYPREVEECLLLHPGVAEVSVIGEPDAEWGESVTAFIVTKEGMEITPQQLDDHCLANIARFKRPKKYVFMAGLPKNNYGKILKTELRARLPERAAG